MQNAGAHAAAAAALTANPDPDPVRTRGRHRSWQTRSDVGSRLLAAGPSKANRPPGQAAARTGRKSMPKRRCIAKGKRPRGADAGWTAPDGPPQPGARRLANPEHKRPDRRRSQAPMMPPGPKDARGQERGILETTAPTPDSQCPGEKGARLAEGCTKCERKREPGSPEAQKICEQSAQSVYFNT